MPLDGRAREAADRVRRRRAARTSASSATPGSRSSRRSARSSRCEPCVDAIAGDRRARLLRRHLGHQRDRRRRVRRALVRRHAPAVLSHGPARTGRLRGAAATTGRSGCAHARSAQAATSGRERYAILLPLNEFEPLLTLPLQQDDPLLRDGGRAATSAARVSAARCGSIVDMFAQGCAPPSEQHPDLQRLERVRPRLFQRSTSPVRGTSASSSGACRRNCRRLDDRAAAGAGRTRRVDRRRHRASCVFRRSRAQGRGVALIEFLSRPAVQRRFHALTGDLPPRRTHLGRSGARERSRTRRAFRDQLERVRPTPKVPEWERIAHGNAPRRRAHRAWRDGRRQRCGANWTRAPTGSSRSGAGCSTQGERGEDRMKGSYAGLDLRRAGAGRDRGVFCRARGRRARAELHRLRPLRARRSRQPAFRRARQLRAPAANAAVLEVVAQHAVLRRSSACRCRSSFRSGAALLLHSRLTRFKAFYPHRAVRAGGNDAGRGRHHLALPVPHTLRTAQLRAGRVRDRPDRLARGSALGDAGDHAVRRCGRTSATT